MQAGPCAPRRLFTPVLTCHVVVSSLVCQGKSRLDGLSAVSDAKDLVACMIRPVSHKQVRSPIPSEASRS